MFQVGSRPPHPVFFALASGSWLLAPRPCIPANLEGMGIKAHCSSSIATRPHPSASSWLLSQAPHHRPRPRHRCAGILQLVREPSVMLPQCYSSASAIPSIRIHRHHRPSAHRWRGRMADVGRWWRDGGEGMSGCSHSHREKVVVP
jgi:hypothetical protein